MRRVIKTYGNDQGFSCTFRQWRAKSHCRFIHGYALGFRLIFACKDDETDENGWVIDFGGLKPIKEYLKSTFDHTMAIAHDDPLLELLLELGEDKLNGKVVQPIVMSRVGCEAFAEMVALEVVAMLGDGELGRTNARLESVEVFEHGSNSAVFTVD